MASIAAFFGGLTKEETLEMKEKVKEQEKIEKYNKLLLSLGSQNMGYTPHPYSNSPLQWQGPRTTSAQAVYVNSSISGFDIEFYKLKALVEIQQKEIDSLKTTISQLTEEMEITLQKLAPLL